jgi:hypothetical protein
MLWQNFRCGFQEIDYNLRNESVQRALNFECLTALIHAICMLFEPSFFLSQGKWIHRSEKSHCPVDF